MTREDISIKQYAACAILFIAMALLSACGGDKKPLVDMDIDYEYIPTMSTVDVATVISDSGHIRYRITAPLWLVFDEAKEPRWNFPQGLHMLKYDQQMKEDASFDCDSAQYLSERKLWRFDSHVKAVNVAGDRFDTDQLFWDTREKKVYTQSFIHIERSDRIIEGYGFTSNERMTEYVVNKVSGIFPVNEDRLSSSANGDTIPPEAPSDTIEKPQPRLVAPSGQVSKLERPAQRASKREASPELKGRFEPATNQNSTFKQIKPIKDPTQ